MPGSYGNTTTAVTLLSCAAAMKAALSVWQSWRSAVGTFDLPCGAKCAVGNTLAGAEEVGADTDALKRIRTMMNKKVKSGEVPMLACSVVKDGRQVLCAGAGLAQSGSYGALPLQPDTILRFYSMTKVVTTLTALLFVEDGKISLDDPISVHISCWDDEAVKVGNSLTPARRPITVRDLVCHTSGLTYGFRTDDAKAAAVATAYRQQRLELPHPITQHEDGTSTAACASLREFVQRLNAIPLASQPGTKFEYSVSTDLLGALLEEVSGVSLEELFQQRIFVPLRMHDTSFTIAPSKLRRMSVCYRSLGVGRYEVARNGMAGDVHAQAIGSCGEDTPYLTGGAQSRTNSGGGGLLSTLNDYTRFVSCLAQGGTLDGVVLIRPETLALAREDQLRGIGARHAGIAKAYQGYGLLGGVVTRAGARGKYLPGDAAAGQGTFAWGGAAGTYFFVDVQNALAAVIVTQLLGYHLGAPTLRPELARAVYEAFPSLKAKLNYEATESDVVGFTG